MRLGVLPDGSGVVFEVTDDHSLISHDWLPPDREEGVFFVRSDGSGLRRLAPPSREASFRIFLNPDSRVAFSGGYFPHLRFSPDGRSVVFTDLGPGAGSEMATQIVTLDLATGKRTQVTRLPAASGIDPSYPNTVLPTFLDNHRIGFLTQANVDGENPSGELRAVSVNTDGTGLRVLNSTAVTGARVVPNFTIFGHRRNVFTLRLPGIGLNGPFNVEEVFIQDGRNLLQLTNFRRFDTRSQALSADGQHAFFIASADPLGTNPTGNCQLFSVNAFGARLRQLTYFTEGLTAWGCSYGPAPGCHIDFTVQDPITRTLVFTSSCGPFGANPSGSQIFAMRPDGSGLRQLTHTRGLVTATDGSFSVEVPGPFAYSAR